MPVELTPAILNHTIVLTAPQVSELIAVPVKMASRVARKVKSMRNFHSASARGQGAPSLPMRFLLRACADRHCRRAIASGGRSVGGFRRAH